MEAFLAVLGFGVIVFINGVVQHVVKAKDPKDPDVVTFIKASDPLVIMMIVTGLIAIIVGAVGLAFSA